MLTGKGILECDTANLRIIMAANLKRLREARGFTQAQMAEVAGVEVNTYQRYEYANLNVPVSKIFRLSQALDCTMDELLPPRGTHTEAVIIEEPTTPRMETLPPPPPVPPASRLGGWIRRRVLKTLRPAAEKKR